MTTKKLINAVKRSPLANSIALHDFSCEVDDIKEWVHYCVELFRYYGLEPTRMGISAPSNRSKKMNSFIREVKKLEQIDSTTITGITLQATMNGSNDSHNDQMFTAWLSLHEGKSTCTVALDNALAPFDRNLWNKICENLASLLKPRYGYAYQREYKKGPEWYPFGICVALDWDKDRQEREELTIWANGYYTNKKYKTGDFRDIYPMNVLSQAHKDHVVEEKPFFDWIAEKPYRGTIDTLNENLWAWWVEPDNISTVREELRPTGLVICI